MGGLQFEVASQTMTTAVIRWNEGDRLLSGDGGSVSIVLVCWSINLGLTPDGSLSLSFPLDFFGLCKSTPKYIHVCKHVYTC